MSVFGPDYARPENADMVSTRSAHMRTVARTNPIPSGVTAIVSNPRDMSIYALYRDNQIIVVQLPLHPDRNTDPDVENSPELFIAANRRHVEELEQIQMLLDRIEFNKSNWVYAVKNPKGGGYELVHRTRRKRQLTCNTWARLISRRDIKFNNYWIAFDIWNGYWNGHEVDCLMAFEDWSIENLDRHMWSYLALQGLDLTYHVFGHLVEDDGTIVGIVQEAHVGRLMQHRDRSIIYDAYSRMQQRGLIYCAATEFYNTHILNGKVRIPALHTIWYFPDEHTCKKQAELRHWQPLDRWFQKMKEKQDNTPVLCIYREWTTVPQLLARFSPDRPLFVNQWMIKEMDEEHGARYRAIHAWLRKLERERKELTFPGGKTSSSRGGVIRRGKTHYFEDVLHPHHSRRKEIDDSSSQILIPYDEAPRSHRRKDFSSRMQAPLSDAESVEETAVEYSRALAIDAQFPDPSCSRPDDGFVSDLESDNDDILVGSAVSLP
ncbi:hypothetical protein C0995_015431 [Termitomyces sp. Mi166|nr:hypothetical protein C0995_015431 [Termitomyces sp. Mi166\